MGRARLGEPTVTIGLPTFNGATFLSKTLDSLLGQDYADFELVISDNGSSDETEEICRSVAARDARVRFTRVPSNRGAAWNYNRVLELARGTYFKWAADDDICRPGFLRSCVDRLDADRDAVLAWPRTLLIDEDDRPIGELADDDIELLSPDPIDRLSRLLRHRVEWHPVFGVVRTDVLRQTRGIGAFILADVALLAELALRGTFLQVDEVLFLRRYHAGRSLVANPSFEEHLAWYDPSMSSRRLVQPNLRLVRELLARTREAPLPPRQRVLASAAVLRCWALPHWRHIGGEVKRGLVTQAARIVSS